MRVKTTRFGEIEVDSSDIITLPNGLIGFAELKQYILLDHDKESPFKWLQSIDDGAIAFVLINPLLFRPDYAVEVTSAEVADLELDSEEDAVISTIITLPASPKNMTANLKAPLIFNLKNRQGKQVVLNKKEYTTRHNVITEMKNNKESEGSQKLQKVLEEAKKSSADDVVMK